MWSLVRTLALVVLINMFITYICACSILGRDCNISMIWVCSMYPCSKPTSIYVPQYVVPQTVIILIIPDLRIQLYIKYPRCLAPLDNCNYFLANIKLSHHLSTKFRACCISSKIIYVCPYHQRSFKRENRLRSV